MIELRKAGERGFADHGWLRSFHSFSFADYHDPCGSDSELVHFLPIWIQPNVAGIAPGYEEKRCDAASKRGRLRLVASPDGRDGSVTIHQDAFVYATLLNGTERVVHRPANGRKVYVHVARSAVSVNGRSLAAGDALKAMNAAEVVLERGAGAEALLFDLP
jgi:redox-sensitive bicupin YhaK (pirin superfamily)